MEKDQGKQREAKLENYPFTASETAGAVEGVSHSAWRAENLKKLASEALIHTAPAQNSGPDPSFRPRGLASASAPQVPAPSSRTWQHDDSSSKSHYLGLTLVYSCPDPTFDLIFVHGLGGTSIGTWSWDRDPVNFWPTWLGDDVELSSSRIFTFGYNASLRGQYTTFNILDFAKDLLFRMKMYAGGQIGTPIGKVCPCASSMSLLLADVVR